MPHLTTVVEVLSAVSRRDASGITAETTLESLGLASIDVLEIVFQLEEKLQIELPDAVAADFSNKTVADVARLVQQIKDGTWRGAE